MLSRVLASFAAAAFAALTVSTAHAAPQMLGVVATMSPQPMTCTGGRCVAQLTSFCLQKERGGPDAGTAYAPFDAAAFTVIYERADGTAIRVSGADSGLAIATERGFAAVGASIPEASLAMHDAVTARIEIAEAATLVPEPVAGDPRPLTENEIAYVTGTLRPMADEWLSGKHEKTAALQTVNSVINLTPPDYAPMDKTALHEVWSEATSDMLDGLPAGAADRAQEIVDACVWRVEVGRYTSLRRCLEVKHDSLLNDLNTTYWQASGAGS